MVELKVLGLKFDITLLLPPPTFDCKGCSVHKMAYRQHNFDEAKRSSRIFIRSSLGQN